MKLYILLFIFPIYRFFKIILPNPKVRIITPQGKVLTAEVISSRLGRALGLSYRRKICSDAALFMFKLPGRYLFHMNGMRFPLDIVFLSSNFEVVYIAYHQRPTSSRFPCPSITSPTPIQYVLEIPAMKAAQWNLLLGSRVKLGLDD